MAADLVEDSTEGAASTAVASGDITQAGVDLAGVAVGAVMAGTGAGAVGVTQAGDAAGVGGIPVGVGAGELASALVGAGVPIGRVTRMPMAILTTITPIIRIIHTMDRMRMRPPTRIGITLPTEIPMTTRRSKIQAIRRLKDRLA